MANSTEITSFVQTVVEKMDLRVDGHSPKRWPTASAST